MSLTCFVALCPSWDHVLPASSSWTTIVAACLLTIQRRTTSCVRSWYKRSFSVTLHDRPGGFFAKIRKIQRVDHEHATEAWPLSTDYRCAWECRSQNTPRDGTKPTLMLTVSSKDEVTRSCGKCVVRTLDGQ